MIASKLRNGNGRRVAIMKNFPCTRNILAASFGSWLLATVAGLAGTDYTKDLGKSVLEEKSVRTWFPDTPPGLITVGVQASEHATGVFLDTITGLWATKERDAFLFLNSRYHYEDNDQLISSTGLGFRKMFGESVIVGGNAYYDAIHSAADNDFKQLGLGAEVLTRWVDGRFNYYLPDDERYETGRFDRSSDYSRGVSGGSLEGERVQHFKTYEAALKGYNAELGFLVPGLDRYTEVRFFGGYYHYDNPFGSDFEGFKARLEARPMPGIMLDVEYWDDAALMGGHWTAGARVSVPFSLFNLASGRNPFEGIAEDFKFRPRAFKERMNEMVIRSHRIQTTNSGPTSSGTSTRTHFVADPAAPTPAAPAPVVVTPPPT